MRRVFKTLHFARWIRKTGLPDAALCEAADEMVAGLIDAELGGDAIKKSVALPGRGKRGGPAPWLLQAKVVAGSLFSALRKMTGLMLTELDALQTLAGALLALTTTRLNAAIEDGTLQEICHDR